MHINTGKMTMDRRKFFAAAIGAGGLFFTETGLFAQTLILSPSTTEGPYYPDKLPLDRDNDLLVINNSITPGIGTISWLSGRILDRTGSPVKNAIVEIWQADNYGSYIHSNGVQNGRRDGNFQGYGAFETASDGQYLFRTIKPGLYTGRVRHVHAKVTLPGGRSLTSQLFIDGEAPVSDIVLGGIANAAQRASVVRPWTAIPGSTVGALAVNWNVVMDYTPTDISGAAKPTLFALGGVTNGATFRRGAVFRFLGHHRRQRALHNDTHLAIQRLHYREQTARIARWGQRSHQQSARLGLFYKPHSAQCAGARHDHRRRCSSNRNQRERNLRSRDHCVCSSDARFLPVPW